MSRHRPQRNGHPVASQAMPSSDAPATSALIDAPPGDEPEKMDATLQVQDAAPQVQDAAPQVQDAAPQVPAPRVPPQVPSNVMIEIPLAPPSEIHYAQQHLRELSGRQARILRRIADGLIADGATLPGGKPVAGSDDALVWWLERVASAGASAGAGQPG